MYCAIRASPIRPILANLLPAVSQDGRGTVGADRRAVVVPRFTMEDIKELAGEALAAKYAKLLETLSRQSGAIGAIFLKAQNEIQDPAKLKRLVGLIDSETWLGLRST